MEERSFYYLLPAGLSPKKKLLLQEYINWKLNDDLKWWEELGVVGRVEVNTMINDNDFYLMELGEHNGEKYYEMQTDYDRYRFGGEFAFNQSMTEFYFTNG